MLKILIIFSKFFLINIIDKILEIFITSNDLLCETYLW